MRFLREFPKGLCRPIPPSTKRHDGLHGPVPQLLKNGEYGTLGTKAPGETSQIFL